MPSRTFQLAKNFSILGLGTLVITIGALSYFYWRQTIENLVAITESNNVVVTSVVSQGIWEKYQSFLAETSNLDDEGLRQHPKMGELHAEIVETINASPIAKVKIYDLNGRVIFSTQASQIGDDKSQSLGFISAKSGRPKSQLGHRDTFQGLTTVIEDRHLLSSYIPIKSNDNEISGVFELYTDVTPLLTELESVHLQTVILVTLISLLAYGALFIFIRRSDELIKNQYHQLKKSETSSRLQANQLNQTLTDLKDIQTQVIQAEKMSGLGQLVAGIAHEINNPISFIYGNISHMRDYLQDLFRLVHLYQQHYKNDIDEIDQCLESIDLPFLKEDFPRILSSLEVGSDRIREIVSSLRSFSRLDEADIKSVDIHKGIEDSIDILNHRLSLGSGRGRIIVVRRYGKLPMVECYAGQLNQVFMNLLSNAIDSLEEKAGLEPADTRGQQEYRIEIKTSFIDKKWIEICVSDNGVGIPEDVYAHIFDPFFTTKPVGRGTGMGMSISYQVVTKKHGGTLECWSQVGSGASFTVRLPMNQTVRLNNRDVVAGDRKPHVDALDLA